MISARTLLTLAAVSMSSNAISAPPSALSAEELAENHYEDVADKLDGCWAKQWGREVPSEASPEDIHRHVLLARAHCPRQVAALRTLMRERLADRGLTEARLEQETDQEMTSYLDKLYDELWGEQ